MKKIITTVIVILCVTSVFAQFQKGRILAGGSIGFSSHTYKSKTNSTTTTAAKETVFNFGPKVGYFVIDKLAVGAGLNLAASVYKPEGSSNKTNNSSISLAPFVRYYLEPGIFFQGGFGFGSGKSKQKNANTTTTTKYGTSEWSIGAGYAYFLNDHVAIEPFVGYQSNTLKSKSPDSKWIDSGLFLNIGFQIYLDPKK